MPRDSKFEQQPGGLNSLEQKETISPPSLYLCPMCQGVSSPSPGECPQCGMPLEPSVPRLNHEEDPELLASIKKFRVSLIFALPVFGLEMSAHLGIDSSRLVSEYWSSTIQFILTSLAIFFVAPNIFIQFFTSLKNRNLNMWTLIGLGVGVTYVYSLVGYLLGDYFPGELGNSQGKIPLYFESVVVIITLVLLGQVLELKARSKTGSAIRSLLSLAPKTSLKLIADGDQLVETDTLEVGDRVRIRPGEKIPTDGRVEEGSSAVDESLLTGESIPTTKQVGDFLTGGSINGTGSLVMKVTEVGSSTVLAKMIQWISEAQRTRPPIQKLADRVASYFVPFVVLVSMFTFIAWFFYGPSPTLAYAIVNSVAVLIIACPCAIGLATPISIVTAVGRGASQGLLIRSAEALELFAKIKIIIVDKTGTLTEGRPEVVEMEAFKIDRQQLLVFAASLERSSGHPLAQAILGIAREIPFLPVKEFTSVTGMGVKGQVDVGATRKWVALGNLKMMGEMGLSEDDLFSVKKLAEKATWDLGATPVFVSMGGRLVGVFYITDPIKETASQTLDELRAEGVKIYMATGDQQLVATRVAKTLNIENYRSEMLPTDKAAWVARLQEKELVAVAGDGVNDAPALARATVGIAMGSGSDIAIESADVVLSRGEISSVLRLRKLSRLTMKNIRMNLFFAFFYNLVGVTLATGLFYPWLGILLSPMLAAAAMSLSSVSVILNALRLKRVGLT